MSFFTYFIFEDDFQKHFDVSFARSVASPEEDVAVSLFDIPPNRRTELDRASHLGELEDVYDIVTGLRVAKARLQFNK